MSNSNKAVLILLVGLLTILPQILTAAEPEKNISDEGHLKGTIGEPTAPATEALPADTPTPDSLTTPSPGSDERITVEIRNLLHMSNVAKGFDVKVSTLKGVVTLTGEVSNDLEQKAVLDVVSQVEGVQEVKNLIQIKPLAR